MSRIMWLLGEVGRKRYECVSKGVQPLFVLFQEAEEEEEEVQAGKREEERLQL